MTSRRTDPTTLAGSEVQTTPVALPQPPVRTPGGLPTHLSMPRQVLAVATWPLLEQLLAFLVGFVDTVLAGHLAIKAVESTDAVGAASYVVWLMGLLEGSVGVGATALIARAVGGRHRREASSALGQSMVLALVGGIAIGIFFFLTARGFGRLMGLEGETLDLCTAYLRLLSVSAPFMTILFIGASCLRGAGDFRSPFGVMVAVNLVNIALSILLVIGPAPLGGRGLQGIALATTGAWCVGGILMMWRLFKGSGSIRLHLHRMRLQPVMLARIMRVSLPNLLESGGLWLGNFVVMGIVGRLGQPGLIGAHMITIRIEAFSFLPGFALSLAAATMVGQYLGAGDIPRARRAVWLCWAYGATLMTGLGFLFILIPLPLVKLVTDQEVFLREAPPLLVYIGWAQLGFATSMVLSGALRGAGDTRATMFLMFFSTYLVRLPLVWLAAMVWGLGLKGVWLAMSAELVFRGLLFLGRFLHGGWAKVKI